jgi:hypothetical protein
VRVHLAGGKPTLHSGTGSVQDGGILGQPIRDRAVQGQAALLGEAMRIHRPILPPRQSV